MTNPPTISLAIVRNKDGKLLLVERAMPEALADATTLTWAFPGGKVESGEATSQTAAREAYEETGYTVRGTTLLYEGPHPAAPVTVAYWACELVGAPPAEVRDPQIARHAWVGIQDLERFITSSIHPAVSAYLRDSATLPLAEK